MLEVEHTQVVPGPYSQFAQRLLGIEGVPQEGRSEWVIVSVDVTTRSEADPNALFVVLPHPNSRFDFLSLSPYGIVIPTSDANFSGSKSATLTPMQPPTFELFTDRSPTPFISSERTTHISRVFQDSAFVRVPVHKTMVVERTLEEKAREAAEFIFSLRKRRFDLLAGDADFIADGKAVEPILQEIQRLEQQYLMLFTGRRNTTRMSQTFDFTPTGSDAESAILCRFAPTKGIVPASDLSAGPILLSITPEQQWKGLEALTKLSMERDAIRPDALYYRLPVPVMIRITQGNSELYSQRLKSYQHGPILRVAAELLPRIGR